MRRATILGGALAFIVGTLVGGGAPAGAVVTTVYTNDFSGPAGSAWSPSTAIYTSPSGERMLGGPFSGTVTESLTIGGLPAHTDVTIDFDLYILLTWDGNGDLGGFGPDFWTAGVAGGPTLQPTTTFASPGCSGNQSFPDPYPATHAPNTGAAAVGTLGFDASCFNADSTYHFSFTFPHTSSSITFDFSSSGLQGWSDEGWGLDNVTVSVAGNQAPDCSGATPSVATLWPPDKVMVDVTVQGITDPDGDATSVNVDSIRQDEPTGPGAHSPDGAGVGTPTASVRRERLGGGDGRVYHVGFTAEDGNGGSCSGTVLVGVPHDQSGDPPVDGGPLEDSTV